jgi:hypothetical protein
MAKLYVTHEVHPGQKCRVHVWLDTKKLVEKFGIEVKMGNRYAHVIKDKTVWLFDSREECVKAIASLTGADYA